MVTKFGQTNQQLIIKVHNALHNKNVKALTEMLENGLDPNLKLSRGDSSKRALTLAVQFDDPRVFDLFIQYGANINLSQVGRNSPLLGSALRNDARGVIRSLAAGADVENSRNRGSKKQEHVMHVAAENGNPEIMRLLLDAGGWKALNRRDVGGQTPATVARVAQRVHRARRVPSKEERQETLALIQRYEKLPRLDFEKRAFSKADVLGVDDQGFSPLEHPETWQRWGEVLDVLAQRGETVSKQDLLETTVNGQNGFERATACFALRQVVAALNRQNEGLTQDELLTPRAEASPLLEQIRQHRQLAEVLTMDNAQHWRPTAFNTLATALDSYEQESFLNHKHQLRYVAEQRQAEQEGSARGR